MLFFQSNPLMKIYAEVSLINCLEGAIDYARQFLNFVL